jgi:hypothetical protein
MCLLHAFERVTDIKKLRVKGRISLMSDNLHNIYVDGMMVGIFEVEVNPSHLLPSEFRIATPLRVVCSAKKITQEAECSIWFQPLLHHMQHMKNRSATKNPYNIYLKFYFCLC